MTEAQDIFHGPPGFGETVEGEVLVSTEGFSPRYDLDRDTGVISRKGHAIEGKSIAGKILVVPSAKGGVAAGWAFYDLHQRGIAPKALICGTTNPVFVQGCVLAGIPIMHELTHEWFFLSHYEILRILPGKWQILGTFVLPNALLAILVLLPFVDRGRERSPRRRRFATAAGAFVCLSIIGLTVKGIITAPQVLAEESTAASLDPLERGRMLFTEKKCVTCHTIAGQGGTQGPNLTQIAGRIRADYFPEWIRNPRNFKPTTEMPSFEGSEEELQAVVQYLLTLD